MTYVWRTGRGAWGFVGWLALALACTDSGNGGGDGVGARDDPRCSQVTCAQSAAAIAWNAPNPTYRAHVRVLDSAGRPLERAAIELGDRYRISDALGRASFEDLPAKLPAIVRITADGYASHLTSTDAFRSGQRTHSMSLVQLSTRTTIDLQQQASLQDDSARVELEPRSLAYADGRRATLARAELASLAPDRLPESARVGGRLAIDRSGSMRPMSKTLAVVYARFTDTQGQALNLAPGQVAGIEFQLADAAEVSERQRLPLLSLDERAGVWREESWCEVSSRDAPGRRRKVCMGHVSHFSFWAVTEPLAAAPSSALGCSRVNLQVEAGTCFKVEVENMFLTACDAAGAQCAPAPSARHALLPSASGQAGYCGVLDRAPSQRAAVLFDVDASGCPASLGIASGRRIKLSDAFTLAAPSAGDAALLSGLEADPAAACSAACQVVELAIGTADLATPVFRDVDDDGQFASDQAPALLASALVGDCDDADPLIHAGSFEPLCAARDQDCDGHAGAQGIAVAQVPDPARWNAACALCREGGGMQLSSEQPGNDYDEDCDGSALDRDADGVPAPADCNDFDAAVAPGRAELPGNFGDEDCDGVAIDQDGDGMPASQHVYLAAPLGLDAALFVDCDDLDPAIHPRRAARDEAGALAAYYYQVGGETRRRAAFCDLLERDGRPNARFRTLVRDLNCDGALTDVDGDGFTAPGDLSLGEAQAFDCDDFDPRVGPNASSAASCGPPSGLGNDAECTAADPADACPALTLSGVVLVTACEEAKQSDGSGTGIGVCAYTGWADGNPLSLEAGALWGPCDGGGPLPDCPADAQCGGPLPYSTGLTGYIESKYTGGQPLTFKGMCFPKCTI